MGRTVSKSRIKKSAEADIAHLERALRIAAKVVEIYPEALPIFERVEAELTSAKATLAASKTDDAVAFARALAQAKHAYLKFAS